MNAPPAAPASSGRGAFGLVWRAAQRFGRHDCSQHAAAIAYYALLSFPPFVLLLAAFASLLLGGSAEDVRASLDSLRPLLPAADDRTWARVENFVASRGVLSFASLALLSWLASRVTASAKKAILTVFDASASDAVASLRARLHAWGITMALLMVLGFVFVGLLVFEWVLAAAPGDVVGAGLLHSAFLRRDLVPSVIAFGICLVVYAWLPPRPVARRDAALGALLVMVLHAVATRLFTLFVSFALSRDAFYGSFVGIISFTAWFYIAAALVLYGAEIVAELEAGRREAPPVS